MKIKTRRYYIYYYLRILIFLASLIPRRVILCIAGFLSDISFESLKKSRKTAIKNLNMAFGENGQRNDDIARGVFKNLIKNGAEWIKYSIMPKGAIKALVTEIEGMEYFDKVLSEGKGVIMLASHFGNWELIPIYFKLLGNKGAVIARKIYFHKYDKLANKLRNRFHYDIIYRDESPKKILRVLRDGGVLGILADQDIPSLDGVFVDFFGKPAYTPTAPVKLAIASGAGMLPCFMVRKKDDTYKLIIDKPIEMEISENREEDVIKYTALWTKVLENYIRKYPEQWAWIHRRWKTQP